MFNYFIKQMKERGTTDKIAKNFEPEPQNCPDYSGKPLGFSNCFTAFGIFLAGFAFSLSFLFFEKVLMVKNN